MQVSVCPCASPCPATGIGQCFVDGTRRERGRAGAEHLGVCSHRDWIHSPPPQAFLLFQINFGCLELSKVIWTCKYCVPGQAWDRVRTVGWISAQTPKADPSHGLGACRSRSFLLLLHPRSMDDAIRTEIKGSFLRFLQLFK